MSIANRKLTYADYLGYPDDGNRHEIIDGDHYMNPAPSTDHQAVSRHIQFQLYSQIELKELGSVINAPVDVQLGESDIVQPDIVVVLKGNRIITPSKVKGAPDHVIEIISPSTQSNDRGLKKSLFEKSGVKEYWIVDPFDHAVEQFVLSGEGYHLREHAENCVPVSYLPDVAVDLTKVW